MTLAELRGAIILRLNPREKVPLAAVDLEIHNATTELLGVARRIGNKERDWIAYTNLVADLDIYPWPDDALELRRLWYLNAGKVPIPMTRIDSQEQGLADREQVDGWTLTYTYTQLPDRRVRLTVAPTSASNDTLKWEYVPRAKRLMRADDEPNLPEQLHECIIPRALQRMGTYDGIRIANPRGFEEYRRQLMQREVDWLQSHGHVVDTDSFYPGGAQ